ncbi:MAG: hypothetical protein ACKOX3_00015 [Bacteroidota bacterium]
MKNLLLIFALLSVIASCKKEQSISSTPEITFDHFSKYADAAGVDTTVDFIFKIKDGDGDIGFLDNEFNTACGADNSNLYIAYEEKNGAGYRPKKIWTQVTDITTNCDTTIYFDSVQVKFNQRMQYIEPPGNSKSIEATVTYRMDYISALILLSTQGRFQFYIRDRANHISNTAVTTDLLLSK